MTSTVLFCTDTLWADLGSELRRLGDAFDVVQLTADQRVSDRDLERITVAYFSADAWPQRSRAFLGTCMRAPNLRWLGSFSAGTDHPVFDGLRARDVLVTNAAGAAAPAISSTVMMYLLALSRDLPSKLEDQRERHWNPTASRELEGLRLGIVGLGAIGGEVARLAAAFGMQPIGVRRVVRGDEHCETWATDRFPELLQWADAIVCTAPLTDETRNLFDADTFALLRRGSWFINVGRGESVDELALADAVRSGHLAGAALDVFATEPLPDDSPLWDLPNVIITPHDSGIGAGSARRSRQLFLDNFERHVRSQPLERITNH